MPQINSIAPDFSLNDQNNNQIKLSDLTGKYVVLYFYPKDLTPGCTVEACEFRDLNQDIQLEEAITLGIGAGTAKTKAKFSEKHDLNFSVLDDVDNKVAELYGVWGEKSMFGKKYMGINRTTFLINPKGEVVYIWKDVNPLGHAKDVLEKLKLSKSNS